MKNKIQKKFNKIRTLIKSVKNYDIIVNIITNEFINIYLHIEKILYDTNFKGNIYRSTDRILTSLIKKVEKLKKIKNFKNYKIIKFERKKIHDNHKYVFQNLWSKYKKEEFIKYRLKNYIFRIKLNNLVPYIKDKNVIDYGCGHGQFLIALKKLGASKCLGIDFGKKSINYAKKISSSLKLSKDLFFTEGNVVNYKSKKNNYDFAIQNGVFHHIDTKKNEIKAYRNVFRSLKKGSFFWIYTQGGGGFLQLVSDNIYETLKNFDKKRIISIIFSKNISINKKYVLSDNFTTKYRFNTWYKLKKELNDIGFEYIRPLKGGMKTDFDKYFSKDKKFKEKFGEGQIRALFKKV